MGAAQTAARAPRVSTSESQITLGGYTLRGSPGRSRQVLKVDSRPFGGPMLGSPVPETAQRVERDLWVMSEALPPGWGVARAGAFYPNPPTRYNVS